MAKPIILTGQVFGRLTALEPTTQRVRGHVIWRCQCSCEKKTIVFVSTVHWGDTQSCGCKRREHALTKPARRHGLSRTAEYRAWQQMWDRCTNANNPRWDGYGGRGITVETSQWSAFENFFTDMGKRPSPKHTLERRDNSRGYSRENCVWATQKEQAYNRRPNHRLTLNGETLCVTEWATRTKIHINTILFRLKKGWSVERTLMTPVRH